MSDDQWKPVTLENCKLVRGPFYHGTKVDLAIGDLLSPGYPSNYQEGRVLSHIYFSAMLEPAIWGAELAMAFASLESRGRIYIVEPTGLFEDDPNLTNKRFPGNPTKSYRTREPLRILGAVEDWQGHSEETIRGMLDSLRELKRRGLYVIEDQDMRQVNVVRSTYLETALTPGTSTQPVPAAIYWRASLLLAPRTVVEHLAMEKH